LSAAISRQIDLLIAGLVEIHQPIGDERAGGILIDRKLVGEGAAVEDVAPCPTMQQIGPRAAEQRIVAVAAIERIGIMGGGDHPPVVDMSRGQGLIANYATCSPVS
jgi:hypothetical protein